MKQHSQKKATVYQEKTYKSYIVRRVTNSLTSLSKKDKLLFSNDIQKWIDCNGKKYAVQRLKDIKQVILNSYSEYHTNNEVPIIDQSKFKSTLKVRANKRILDGYLGDLQRNAIHSPKVLKQVLQLLHAYTLIVDEDTSPEDIRNLRDIIEPRPEPQHQEFIDKFCNDINGAKLMKFFRNTLQNVQVVNEAFTLVNGKATKTVNIANKDKTYLIRKPIGLPSPYMLEQPTEAHEDKYYISDYIAFARSELAYKIYQYLPELWENCFPQISFEKGIPEKIFPVGRMALLNEGGLKKRWVENTHHVIQYIVKPFGNRLYDLVKYAPWDCTFDEYRGISTIQIRLQQGRMCYSVDLSKATDKMPMDYNMAVLRKLFKLVPDGVNHLEVFNLIARAHVYLPDISKDYPDYRGPLYTKWGTGQPMGAYPSFAMLSLVHGIILFILNGYEYNNDFIVHGDDVVILNDTLFSKYVEFLENSGMEYSPYKTIAGTKFAEMNSKIILSDRVLSPVKWKEISSRNVLDVAQYWGVDLCSKLAQTKHYNSDVVRSVLALPYPLGAGLNPEGLDLESRLARFPGLIDSLIEESETQKYYTSYRDLVLERYSKCGTHQKWELHPQTKKLVGTKVHEMDYATYLALLRDLERADIADRQCAQLNCGIIPDNFRNLDTRWLNILFLSGNTQGLKGKCSQIKQKSSTRERKKRLKLRFEKAASYYVAPVKRNSDMITVKQSLQRSDFGLHN